MVSPQCGFVDGLLDDLGERRSSHGSGSDALYEAFLPGVARHPLEYPTVIEYDWCKAKLFIKVPVE